MIGLYKKNTASEEKLVEACLEEVCRHHEEGQRKEKYLLEKVRLRRNEDKEYRKNIAKALEKLTQNKLFNLTTYYHSHNLGIYFKKECILQVFW